MPTRRERRNELTWERLRSRIDSLSESDVQALIDSANMPSAPKLWATFVHVLRNQLAKLRERYRSGYPPTENVETDIEVDDTWEGE